MVKNILMAILVATVPMISWSQESDVNSNLKTQQRKTNQGRYVVWHAMSDNGKAFHVTKEFWVSEHLKDQWLPQMYANFLKTQENTYARLPGYPSPYGKNKFSHTQFQTFSSAQEAQSWRQEQISQKAREKIAVIDETVIKNTATTNKDNVELLDYLFAVEDVEKYNKMQAMENYQLVEEARQQRNQPK